MALLLVFTASASALALEALLARYFALTQWHHLSFMVISVALLGFSASGTWLNLVATRRERSGAGGGAGGARRGAAPATGGRGHGGERGRHVPGAAPAAAGFF